MREGGNADGRSEASRQRRMVNCSRNCFIVVEVRGEMSSKRRKTLVSMFEKIGITFVVALAVWCVGVEMAEPASGVTSSASTSSPSTLSQSSEANPNSGAAPEKTTVVVSGSSTSSSSKASSASSTASAKSPASNNAQVTETTQDNQTVVEEQPADDAAIGQYGSNQETENASSDTSQTQKKKPSKGSQAKPSSSNQSDSSTQPEQKRVWIEPVYEDVYHEEQGHWETRTRTVTKYYCGGTDHNPGDPNYDGPFGGPSPMFDDYDGWAAHQEAFIAEMRKDDPYYVCTGRHRPALEMPVEEEYEEYVVDEAAWTERVLVSEGYWKYV